MSDDRKEVQTQRILEALAAGPMSARQLREKLHLSPAQMGKYLSRLSGSPRLVRVAGHERTCGGKGCLYGLGSAPDAVFVRKENFATTTRLERQMERVRKLLETPRTAVELQTLLHRSKAAVQKYLSSMRESKEVYIHSWRETESVIMYAVPVYALGKKADAKNEKRAAKRNWIRLKEDKDRHDVYKARKRMKAHVKIISKKPQNIFSALGL